MADENKFKLNDADFRNFVGSAVSQIYSDEISIGITTDERASFPEIQALLQSFSDFFLHSAQIAPHCSVSFKKISTTWYKEGTIKKISIPNVYEALKAKINDICLAYKEYKLFNPEDDGLPTDVDQKIQDLIKKNPSDWLSLKKTNEYAEITITRSLIGSYKSFDNAQRSIDSLGSRVEHQDAKFREQETKITDLEKRIETLKSDVAFVELTKAFIALKDKQVWRWRVTLAICCVIFITLILTPLIVHWNVDKALALSDWLKYVQYVWPFVAVEFFLIYGFRIVYSNLKSTDAQITQLEIRIALCQFIDGYKAFVSKTHDKQPVEKFESLVFSGLSMDAADIPTTFDGLEQVSKIVEAFKSAKT